MLIAFTNWRGGCTSPQIPWLSAAKLNIMKRSSMLVKDAIDRAMREWDKCPLELGQSFHEFIKDDPWHHIITGCHNTKYLSCTPDYLMYGKPNGSSYKYVFKTRKTELSPCTWPNRSTGSVRTEPLVDVMGSDDTMISITRPTKNELMICGCVHDEVMYEDVFASEKYILVDMYYIRYEDDHRIYVLAVDDGYIVIKKHAKSVYFTIPMFSDFCSDPSPWGQSITTVFDVPN